jgi:hypothetical protein
VTGRSHQPISTSLQHVASSVAPRQKYELYLLVKLLFTVHNHQICSCWVWRESPQPCSGLNYFQRAYLILLPLWVLGPSVCFVWQPVKVLRATLINQEVF